jgi:chromosome segregation ATPase
VSNEQLPRKELCNHGHPLTGDNLGYQSRVPPRSGYYFCKTCKKAARPVTRIAALEADLQQERNYSRALEQNADRAVLTIRAEKAEAELKAAQERIEELKDASKTQSINLREARLQVKHAEDEVRRLREELGQRD